MASPFETMARVSRSLVERVHGSEIRLSFMTAGGQADPSRPQITVCAIVSVSEPDMVAFRGPAKNHMRSADIGACDAVLFLDLATYQGPDLAVGDRVRAMDWPGRPVWQVAQRAVREAGLLKFPLTEVGN